MKLAYMMGDVSIQGFHSTVYQFWEDTSRHFRAKNGEEPYDDRQLL